MVQHLSDEMSWGMTEVHMKQWVLGNLKLFRDAWTQFYLSDKMGWGVGGGEKNCQELQVSCGGFCQNHLKE